MIYTGSQKSLRLKKRFLRTGINTRPEGACEGRAALGLRNALKQAKEGLFKSQIKHTISHFKLTASQLVRRSLGEGGRLSNHLTEKTFEKRYITYLQKQTEKYLNNIFN